MTAFAGPEQAGQRRQVVHARGRAGCRRPSRRRTPTSPGRRARSRRGRRPAAERAGLRASCAMNANCGLVDHDRRAPEPHALPRCARRSSSCPAASELAIGFSLQTCLPASIACRLSRSCSCMSVRLTSRSNAAPGQHLVDVRVLVGDLELLRLALARAREDVAGADELDVRGLRPGAAGTSPRRCRSR